MKLFWTVLWKLYVTSVCYPHVKFRLRKKCIATKNNLCCFYPAVFVKIIDGGCHMSISWFFFVSSIHIESNFVHHQHSKRKKLLIITNTFLSYLHRIFFKDVRPQLVNMLRRSTMNAFVGSTESRRFPLSFLHIRKHCMYKQFRGTHRQFSENICSEDDLRSRIFKKLL